MKKHNFSAGPSILPRSVIEQASNGILNINNSNLSLIEISHRSKDFVEIMDRATTLALDLLNLNNKGYKALFLQGGASLQFLMTAYNLLENKAGYINTGAWSTKALKEAKNFGDAIEVATSKDANFNYIPKNYSLDSDLDYLHITTNNTIFGTQFHELPKTNTNLICDMSSDIFFQIY
jgi:phosphoserine aminotransferase